MPHGDRKHNCHNIVKHMFIQIGGSCHPQKHMSTCPQIPKQQNMSKYMKTQQPKITYKEHIIAQISLPRFDTSKGGHSSSDSESWAVAGCGGEAGVLAGNGGPVVEEA